MALATICPHCNTTFRVASDQLKLRGGIVRCGACNEVFDGNAALIDLDTAAPAPEPVSPPEDIAPDEPAPAAPGLRSVGPDPALVAAAITAEPPQPIGIGTGPAASEAVPEESASAAFDAEIAEIEAKQEESVEEPVITLDFDTTFDPFGILPKTEPEPETAEPEPAVDEEIIALPPPDEGLAPIDDALDAPARDRPADLLASLLMRESAAAEPVPALPPELPTAAQKSVRRHAAKRRKAAPKPVVPIEPAPVPEDEEPAFVRRIRQQEQTGRTRRIVMGAASGMLVLALAFQAMTTFRNVLAARYPAVKPALVAACAPFGCKVELPAQIDMLSVETGELQSLSANTFSYSTLVRNQGSLVQAWPHIELALTDANDKPVVRRVFAPAQYLPAGVPAAKGIGPRSEQPVKLFFELDQVKASGYHVAIFYP
ncbi:MAG: hypothetical protein JWP34_934 [Massilia sp.]|nr:hypothetical protein [Massilia sp.]